MVAVAVEVIILLMNAFRVDSSCSGLIWWIDMSRWVSIIFIRLNFIIKNFEGRKERKMRKMEKFGKSPKPKSVPKPKVPFGEYE